MPFSESDVAALLGEAPAPVAPSAPPPPPTLEAPAPAEAAPPAAGAWTPGSIDGLLDAAETEKDERLRGLLTVALPDGVKHREALLELSKRTGRRVEELEVRYDDVATQWDAARRDVRRFRQQAPELATLLLDNPALTDTVVKDAPLSIFSNAWNAAVDVVRDTSVEAQVVAFGLLGRPLPQLFRPDAKVAPRPTTYRQDAVTAEAAAANPLARTATIAARTFEQSSAGMRRAQLGWQLLVASGSGQPTWQLEKAAQDAALEALPRDFSAGPWEQLVADVAEGAASQFAVYREAAPVAVASSAAAAAATYAATRSPAAARQAAGVGLRLGGVGGVAWGSLQLEAGSAFLEYRGATTDDGQKVTEEEARGAALLYGALAAGVEVASFSVLLDALGGFGQAAQAGASKLAAAELLRSQAARNVARAAAKAWGQSATGEFTEEVLQAGLESATKYALRSYSAGELQQTEAPDVESYLMQGQKAAVGALGTTMALTSVQTTVALLHAQRSEAAGRRVAALAGLADSPTTRAAPAAVAQMVEAASRAGGAPVTHLYVDAAALQVQAERQGTDGQELALQLLGEDGPTLMQDALRTGGKLEVPLGTYLERLGITSLAEVLVEDTTTSPTLDTPREARAKRAGGRALREEVKRRAEEIAARWEEGQQQSDAERQTLDVLEQQLVATGAYDVRQARLALAPLRAFAETMAARFNKSADELFAGYALRIQRDGGDAALVRLGRVLSSTPAGGTPTPSAPPTSAPPAQTPPTPTAPPPPAAQTPPTPTAPPAPAAQSAAPAVGADLAELLADAIAEGQAEAAAATTPEGAVSASPQPLRMGDALGSGVLGGPMPSLPTDMAELPTDAIPAPLPVAPATVGDGVRAWVASRTEVTAAQLQREFRMAAGRALDVLATLEAEGLVAPAEGGAPRKVRQAPAPLPLFEAADAAAAAMPAAEATAVPAVSEATPEALTDFEDWEGLAALLDDSLTPLEAAAQALEAVAQVEEAAVAGGLAEVVAETFDGLPDSWDPPQAADAPMDPADAWEYSRRAPAAQPVATSTGKGLLAVAHLVSEEVRESWDADYIRMFDDMAYGATLPTGETLPLDVRFPTPLEYFLEAEEKVFKRLAGRKSREAKAAALWREYLLAPHGKRRPGWRGISETEQEKEAARKVERQLERITIADPHTGFYMENEPATEKLAGLRAKQRRIRRENRPVGGNSYGNPDSLRHIKNINDPRYWGRKLVQGDEANPRGFIVMGQTAEGRAFSINLTETADTSTFLHETGHLFLELFADLAERPDAPESVRKDYAAALQWLGVSNRTEVQREHHEKWARGFESYLMEGKGPSAALQRAFTRFKLWLVALYQRTPPEALSDDIRGVFDRLLAGEEEVAKVRREMGLQRLFRTPTEAGMTPEEFQRYLQAEEEATSDAAMRLQRQLLRETLRETEAAWQEEYRRELEAAEADYEKLPARQAQLAIRSDTFSDTPGQPMRLDRRYVEEKLGADAKRFPLTKEGGTHPDELADYFGFATGEEVLRAVLALPEKAAWAKEKATAAMAERHGDLVRDMQTLREEAAKGLHGEATAGWLLQEMKTLQARAFVMVTNPETGTVQAIPNETFGLDPTAELEFRAAARVIASRRKAGQLDAGRVRADERRAAQRALEASARGNYAQALTYKKQQLLNFFLHRELQDAVEDREKVLEAAAQYSKDAARARLGKAHPIYRGAMEALLVGVGLKEKADAEEVLPSLYELTQQLQADAATVAFDVDPLARTLALGTPWRQLSVAELRNLLAAVQTIRGAANARTTVLLDGKRVDKDALVEELVAEAERNLPKLAPLPSSQSAATAWERLNGTLAGIDGTLLRPALMVKWLGGGDIASTWVRALVQPLQDAKHREAELLRRTVLPILQAFEALPSEARASLQDKVDGARLFPNHREELPAPTRRFELLMMALNSGNASNLHRLLEGRRITRQQLDAALATLTKTEWDWVQTVWDSCEALWPEVAALEERDAGLRPAKIPALPMVTPHGTYRGGYFPAVYDRRVEVAGERQEASALADLLDPSYVRPGTSHSHTKARAGDFSGVISLEPSIIQTHLAKVARDLSHREAVKSVGGLVLDERVRRVMRERLGDERAQQFLQWVKDVGQLSTLSNATAGTGALLRVMQWAKSNTVVGVLGYSAQTALGDFANLAAVLPATSLKARHLAGGLASFLRHPLQTLEATGAASAELRYRRDSLRRELTRQMRELSGSGPYARGPLAVAREYAFVFMEWSDMATSTPIWLGAFNQSLAEGQEWKAAVAYADNVVREVFPSHAPVDVSALMRDRGAVGALLLFHGYFNTVYNNARDIVHQLHIHEDLEDKLKVAPVVGARLTALLLATGLLGEFLSGRGKEKDEEWQEYLFRKLLGGAAAVIPFGGDVWAVLEGAAMNRRPNVRASPAVAAATGVVKALETAGDDTRPAEERLRRAVQGLGPAVGLPTMQPLRTGGYLYDVATGAEVPAGPADFTGGVIYGKRERQGANPASVVSDALEK